MISLALSEWRLFWQTLAFFCFTGKASGLSADSGPWLERVGECFSSELSLLDRALADSALPVRLNIDSAADYSAAGRRLPLYSIMRQPTGILRFAKTPLPSID
jgi:hypothetical protein